ncbi:MAG: hypothetical protein JEZ06_05145 [Anaerolineaceae bacterium]|nr:hypothetical protein [Anaerolineaceae bacterium]
MGIKERVQILFWVAVFLVLAVGASLIIPRIVAASPQLDENTPQQGSAELAEINRLEELLASGNLDEQAQKSVQEKLEMAQRIVTQQAESAEKPPQAADLAPAPKMINDPGFQSGIFEGGEGIFHASEAVIENYWQAVIGNQYVQIFAGVSGSDAQQGVVIIITTEADRMDPVFQTFPTPQQKGSVRILSEENQILQITAQDGSRFQFSITEKQFLP